MGQPGIVHSFRDQLDYSETASGDEFWEICYRKAFPTMLGQQPVSGDNQGQRLGIDRFVFLASGKVLAIDEKKRRIDRSDILLEYLSNDVTGAPGWIEKDLQIDFLAYAFMESRRVYLFPWEQLRRAWIRFGADWIATHKRIEAQNHGYKTICVAVPTVQLRKAVSLAGVIDL